MSVMAGNTISIGEAKDMILGSYLNAYDKNIVPANICLHGKAGTGKSSIIYTVAEILSKTLDITVKVEDIRLAGMEPSDVLGIPFLQDSGDTEHKKEMVFSTPDYIPKTSKIITILFFDELMNCNQSVQKAAYRIINDRTVQNGVKLPDNCMVIAAGNLKEEKTGATQLLPALANRFAMHLIIDEKRSHADYINHFVSKKFDPSIIAFLESNPHRMYSEKNSVEAAFATPRTWEMVNNHAVSNNYIRSEPKFLFPAVSGGIGTEIATEYISYLENQQYLPDWNKIKNGEDVDLEMRDDGFKLYLAISLLSHINLCFDNKDTASVENLFKFGGDFLSIEALTVMFKIMKRSSNHFMQIPLLENGRKCFDKVKPYIR